MLEGPLLDRIKTELNVIKCCANKAMVFVSHHAFNKLIKFIKLCNSFICKIQIKIEGLLSETSVRLHQTFDQNPITLNLWCLSSELWLSGYLFTDLVAQRGEKLELLIDKTENLVDSVSLKKSFPYLSYLFSDAQYFAVHRFIL